MISGKVVQYFSRLRAGPEIALHKRRSFEPPYGSNDYRFFVGTRRDPCSTREHGDAPIESNGCGAFLSHDAGRNRPTGRDRRWGGGGGAEGSRPSGGRRDARPRRVVGGFR